MRLLLFLITFSTYGQVEQVVGPTLDELDRSVISDINAGKVDEITAKNIMSSIQLKNEIDRVIDEEPCLTDKEKNKKRHVVKSKTIEDETFEMVFLAQATNVRAPEEEDLEFVNSTLESEDVLNSLRKTKNEREFYATLEEKIIEYRVRDRTLKEQAEFAARLSDAIKYSYERAEFQPAFNQGRITTNDLIKVDESKYGGICGDIHMAHNDFIKKINPSLEAFTMSYATKQGQHVISMIVDPEDPTKMILNNYDRIQVKNMDGVTSASPQEFGNKNDIGERDRFYQYKGDRQEHIGTFRNSIGSLLYNLAMDKNMRSAIVDDKPYDLHKFKMTWGKTVNEAKKIYKDGELDKIKNKTFKINSSLTFFRAKTTEGHELMGILAKKDKRRNTNQYGELKSGEVFGTYANTSLNLSQTDYNRTAEQSGPFYRIYFATGKKVITRIIEKDGFVFDGYLNAQLEGSLISDKNINVSGDADITVTPGLSLKKRTEKSSLDANLNLNLSPGLVDQVQVFSPESYPENLQLTPNSLNADVSYKRFLERGKIIGAQSQYIGTQLGGQFRFSILHETPKSGKIILGYSTPTGGISSNKTNILPRNYQVITTSYTSPELSLGKRENAATLQGRVNTEIPLDPVPFRINGGIILKFGNGRRN